MGRLWITIVGVGLLACSEPAQDPGQCIDGEGGQAADECNYCGCSDGAWGVTQVDCSIAIPAGYDVACYDLGVGDVDPIAPGLQIECVVLSQLEIPQGLEVSMTPMCARGPEGWTWPAADVDGCWFARSDTTRTGDPADDVSAECIERRGDRPAVEIEVLRRPDTEALLVDYSLHCAPPEPICPGEDADDP